MSEKIIQPLYNGEVKIVFYPESHRYKLDGEKTYLVSVTAATGILDKSRVLIPWAVGLAGQHLREYLEDAKTNQFTREELYPVIEEALKQHEIKKEKAANVGSKVHDWVERFAIACLNDTERPEINDIDDEQVLLGINAFVEWFNAHSVKFHATERLLFSREFEYAGITDAVAEIDKKKYLIDYKTSKGIYSEMYYQVAGYWKAYEEETKDELAGAIILKFGKEDGNFETKEFTREDLQKNFEIFAACLAIKKREKELYRK
ncbi:MAG: hypothetical protein ACOZBH_04410 [Patescibacteria group bacterium]